MFTMTSAVIVQVYPCSSPELIVRCSSFAMCQRSEVFQRMLTSSMAESSSRRVELPAGVSMSAIKALRHICHLELDALQVTGWQAPGRCRRLPNPALPCSFLFTCCSLISFVMHCSMRALHGDQSRIDSLLSSRMIFTVT